MPSPPPTQRLPSYFYPGSPDKYDLEGKIFAITGVTGGMARAIMRGVLALGATVAMIGRDTATIEGFVAENHRYFPGKSTFHHANLEVEAEVRAAAADVLAKHGHVDILINGAGLTREGRWQDIPLSDLDYLFKVNVASAFILCQCFADSLVASRGQVVFMNSSSVQTVAPEKTLYTTTKYAMKGLADSFRAEFNRQGVRTLSIFPGRTATDMQKRLHEGRGEEFHPETLIQPEDVAGTVIHLLQMPLTAEVTEVFIRPNVNWKTATSKL